MRDHGSIGNKNNEGYGWYLGIVSEREIREGGTQCAEEDAGHTEGGMKWPVHILIECPATPLSQVRERQQT